MTHDSLCPLWSKVFAGDTCDCDLIAKVREDELAKCGNHEKGCRAMNRLHDLMSSSQEGRRRLAAARLRREVLVNLESALEESGMTQSALASALGRTRSAVNQVFGGDGNIRISTLAEYLHAMGQELVLTRVPEGATRARLWQEKP